MVKVITKGKKSWTPLKIDGKAISGVENLLAIEELTDYSLERIKGAGFTKSKKKKKPKKKPLKGFDEVPAKKTELKTPKKRPLNVPDEVPVKKAKLTKNVFTVSSIEDEETDVEEQVDSSLSLPWTNIFVPDLVIKALIEKGFYHPTEIQRLSIPAAIKGRRDILGAAETGSGKTLAFGIPIIYGILKNLEKNATTSQDEGENDKDENNISQDLYALILTPTRELAVQIKDHLQAVTKYTSLQVAVIVGGMSAEKQTRILSHKPEIVVATPGRLWDLIQTHEPHFKNIETIKYLVIDETDRMLEANHFPELRSLLERINMDPEAKKLRQNFVFSATLTLVHQPPQHIVKKRWKKSKDKLSLTPAQKLDSIIQILGITDPKVVDITNKTGLASTLTEARILSKIEEKDFYVYYFLLIHPGRTLVFCNSIECVKRLASLLSHLNVKPLPLHSNMIQKQRLKNLERFSAGNGVLIATDVAARGLDIPDTEHVIHYQIPRTSESYVHRSGRTGRASKPGLTVLLVSPEEVTAYAQVLTTLNRDTELKDFPIKENIFRICKDRMNAARDLDRLLLQRKRECDKRSWFEKTAQEADLILDESLQLDELDSREEKFKKRAINIAKKHLENLLKEEFVLSQESAVEKIIKSTEPKNKLKIIKAKKNLQKNKNRKS